MRGGGTHQNEGRDGAGWGGRWRGVGLEVSSISYLYECNSLELIFGQKQELYKEEKRKRKRRRRKRRRKRRRRCFYIYL